MVKISNLYEVNNMSNTEAKLRHCHRCFRGPSTFWSPLSFNILMNLLKIFSVSDAGTLWFQQQ